VEEAAPQKGLEPALDSLNVIAHPIRNLVVGFLDSIDLCQLI